MAHGSREKRRNGEKEIVTIRNVPAIGRCLIFYFSINLLLISNRSVTSSDDESR